MVTLGPRPLAATAVLCAAFLALPPVAVAHVPALEQPAPGVAVPVDGPDVSRALYGYLAPGEEHDDYSFSVRRPVTSTVGIIVPAYAEHRDFRPTLVIETEDGLPIAIKDPGLAERETEWEPFSLTTFWRGGDQPVSFEPGVEYAMRVEPAGGPDTGRYVIVFGGPEEFTGADISATARSLPTIWTGSYGGAPARWSWWILLPALTVSAILGLAIWGILRLATVRRA